jgi:hypothetical protein
MVRFLKPSNKSNNPLFSLSASLSYYVLLAPVKPVEDSQTLKPYHSPFSFFLSPQFALHGRFSLIKKQLMTHGLIAPINHLFPVLTPSRLFLPVQLMLFIQRTKGYGFTVNRVNNPVGKGQPLSPGIPQKEA